MATDIFSMFFTCMVTFIASTVIFDFKAPLAFALTVGSVVAYIFLAVAVEAFSEKNN